MRRSGVVRRGSSVVFFSSFFSASLRYIVPATSRLTSSSSPRQLEIQPELNCRLSPATGVALQATPRTPIRLGIREAGLAIWRLN